jgi:hypothetical protein
LEETDRSFFAPYYMSIANTDPPSTILWQTNQTSGLVDSKE